MGFSKARPVIPFKEATRAHRSLSLRRLRRCLQDSAPLPKELFADTDLAGLQNNAYRYRDRKYERAALRALACIKASAEEHELALRVCNCRSGHRCGRLLCFICNQKYWRRRRALLTRFEEAGPSTLSWCTVVVGVSQIGYPILEDMIIRFKTEFSETMSRYPETQWSGRLEIDYIDGAIVQTKPEKLATLAALGQTPCEIASLVPHVHLVVHHPGVRRETIAFHLKRAFVASRQVQVRAFRTTRATSTSLDALARYPLKPPLLLPAVPRDVRKCTAMHLAALRYVIRIREVFDRPANRGLLEFDRMIDPGPRN